MPSVLHFSILLVIESHPNVDGRPTLLDPFFDHCRTSEFKKSLHSRINFGIEATVLWNSMVKERIDNQETYTDKIFLAK